MKTIIAYGFTCEEIEQLCLELDISVSYDMGIVSFGYDGEWDAGVHEIVLTAIKEKYHVHEDLTNFNWFVQDGDQYWDKPILLMPTGGR